MTICKIFSRHRHAKHPAIGDSKMKALPQSSQLDLDDTMHGYMHTMADTGERDYTERERDTNRGR